MNEKILVKLSADWADEMTIYNVAVISRVNAKWMQDSAYWPVHVYFGTNEEGDVHLSDFAFEEIPDGLDPDVLDTLLENAYVANVINMVIDKLDEAELEVREKEFDERFRQAILSLPDRYPADVVARDIEHVAALKKVHGLAIENHSRNAWQRQCPNWADKAQFGSCKCDDCQLLKEEVNKAWQRVVGAWAVVAAMYHLGEVYDYNEFGDPSHVLEVIMNMPEYNDATGTMF